MVGICSFILIVLFGIPISLIIDHTIDYRRALQKHRMFPDVYPNPKKKRPRKLTEEERQAIEKSRQAVAEAQKWVAERDQKIRDLFYEDYVSSGDYVKIKPTGEYNKNDPRHPIITKRPGIYRVVKTGASRNENGTEIYGCYGRTYDPYKRARIALCEQIKTESGELVDESERTQTICACEFSKLIKCSEFGDILYNDIREWGKEQEKKLNEATGLNNDHTPDRYRNQTAIIKKALCIPNAYAKYTSIQQAFGVYL